MHVRLLALFAVAASACAWEAPSPSTRLRELRLHKQRAYVIERQTQSGRGRVVGDLALEGSDLQVQVRASGQNDERGALVAMRQNAGSHDWESLRPMLAVDGALLEPQVLSMAIERVGDRPAIIIDALVQTERAELRMRRVMRIADVPSALRISSFVYVSRGAPPESLQVVERVAFGGGHATLPMHGQLLPETPVEAEWLAHPVGREAVLVAALEGPVRVIGHNTDHGLADLIRYSDVWLPTRPISQRGHSAELVLSASLAGLGQAVRALGWVRGKPFTEALAMLSSNPPDVQVEVIDEATGKLVVLAVPDDQRRAILPLPPEALGRELAVSARTSGVEATAPIALAGPPYAPLAIAIPESATLRVSVSEQASGEPLPARVRILPLRGARALNLGPDYSGSGALDTIIVASGQAEIKLQPGYYRVIVTHGPEWTVTDQSLELGIGKLVQLNAQLERAIQPGPWVPCELHVHQAPSPDSQVTLEDRVASLVAEGIAFAVPTDHNHVTDLGAAIAAQPLAALFSVPGVEVTTEQPAFGHFNAYPFPLDPSLPGQNAPAYLGLRPAELFSSLHALDPEIVVQVNHPRLEGGIGYFDAAEYDAVQDRGGALWSQDFDALEVWNGFDLARQINVERVLNDWLNMLEHGHRVVATGSSDSHTIRSEGAGYPRTYVHAPLAGVAHGKELVRALRAGRAFVTSGPFLTVRIGKYGIGDTVELHDKQLSLDVFVQVPAWMQVSTLRVYLGAKLLRTVPLGTPSQTSSAARRYQRTLNLPSIAPGPLVVAVEGEATLQPIIARQGVKPFAFTNPIWLVREGEGGPVQDVRVIPHVPASGPQANEGPTTEEEPPHTH
jgi:hypothetical protein